MAVIPRRRTGELLRKVFEILLKYPDGLPAGEVLQRVAAGMTLTEYELGEYDSGGRRFDKILRFATIDCARAGWMVKERGRWALTDDGRKAFQALSDPEAFAKRASQLYNQWRKSQSDAESPEVAGSIDADKAVEGERAASITYEEAEEQAWGEISRYLKSMPPYDFQELVAALLRGMGYHVGWVAPPGKDGGTDILAYGDPLGTRPPRIKVQVKRQEQKVSVDGLRSFLALLGADDVGLFVNAGGFTKDAEDEARKQSTRHVTLVDLAKLFDLWVEHYSRLDEGAKRRLPLQPIHFLAPEG